MFFESWLNFYYSTILSVSQMFSAADPDQESPILNVRTQENRVICLYNSVLRSCTSFSNATKNDRIEFEVQ